MTELWKEIPGWEGLYEVSNLGKVRSKPRWVRSGPGGGMRQMGGAALKPSWRGGYLKVTLAPGKKTKSVHHLVASTFLGPRPEGMDIRHLDGNRENNAITNLAYGTRSENLRDGYLLYDGRHASKKLSASDVREIKRLLREGIMQKEIAPLFGVAKNTISNINTGKLFPYIN